VCIVKVVSLLKITNSLTCKMVEIGSIQKVEK
jgi:hypothetical protein